MKTITVKWLEKHNACIKGVEWFRNQTETDPIKLIEYFIKHRDKEQLQWGNWLIVRLMKYKQYLSYAIFAAEQVISIYEKKYPDDKRPRKAIEAAKKYLKNSTKENKADATYAVAAAAADAATYDAAYIAADAADAANKKITIKILNYGLKLLK